MRRFAPFELLDRRAGAFVVDAFESGRWTFSCAMHDDDWANRNLDLAQGLAELSPGTRGVVVAAQSERVIDAWLLAKGAAREVSLPTPVPFAPSLTIEGMREALAALEIALAAIPRPRATALGRVLPGLIKEHLGTFGLEETGDPLRYSFAGQRDFELHFVPSKREYVPFLRHLPTGASQELQYLPKEKPEQAVAALARLSYDSLAAQWPLFRAGQGERVPAEELLASLHEARWQVQRIATAQRTHPEVIQTCVDFLLSGVWDEVARENLIRFVGHANCPRSIAERLATHASQSLKNACKERLQHR